MAGPEHHAPAHPPSRLALLGRRFAIGRRGAAYAVIAGALILLLAAAGTRTLLSRTSGNGARADGGTAAEQAFRRWTLQAVPLLVRYKDALAADASPSVAPTSGRSGGALRARVEHARRRLLALEPPIRRLVRSAPAELRTFMPLLTRAVTLAAAAQRRYEASLATHGRRSHALLLQANGLLRRSQQAMAAFSIDVNGVGDRLANG